MKLDIETLIKYAYSDLPDEQLDAIELLFEQDEYSLEFEAAQGITQKALVSEMTQSEMLDWVQKSSHSAIATLKKRQSFINDSPSFLASFADEVRHSREQLLRWFDEAILLKHPALATVRSGATNGSATGKAVVVNFDESTLHLSIQIEQKLAKPLKLTVEDVERQHFLKEKMNVSQQPFSFDLSDKTLHPGAYIWLLNSSEIDLQSGIFYVQKKQLPKQS